MTKKYTEDMDGQFHISFILNKNIIEFNISDKSELKNKASSLLVCADYLDMIDISLTNRKKYRDLFRVTVDGIIFLIDIEDWTNFEKVAIVLLTNYPIPTERKDIWPYGVESDPLRGVIFNKREELFTIGENLVGLTQKGLHFIEKRLSKFM